MSLERDENGVLTDEYGEPIEPQEPEDEGDEESRRDRGEVRL